MIKLKRYDEAKKYLTISEDILKRNNWIVITKLSPIIVTLDHGWFIANGQIANRGSIHKNSCEKSYDPSYDKKVALGTKRSTLMSLSLFKSSSLLK